MSATLTETIESLHITAAKKLLELIQAETDPHLLARLIATAFRFKLPKRSGAGADDGGAEGDSGTHRPSNTTTRPPANPSPPADQSEKPGGEELHVPPPPPYTDQQYLDLVKQYGHAEAAAMRQRRFAIIAHLSRHKEAAAAAG